MPVEVTAPSSAPEGNNVNVSVVVTNTLGFHATFLTEIWANTDLIFSIEEIISNGTSKEYSASFTMPANDVTVRASVERWKFDHMEYYGSANQGVTLEGPPPLPPGEFTLSTSVSPSGIGNIVKNPDKTLYYAGEDVGVSAFVKVEFAETYEFSHLSIDGGPRFTGRSVYLVMDADHTIVAFFRPVGVPPPEFTLSTSVSPSGIGNIVKDPDKALYYAGEGVGIQAFVKDEFAETYEFSHLSIDGGPPFARFWFFLSMHADHTIVAFFTPVGVPSEPQFRGFAVSEYTKR